jgi:MYXO-CTERM domain-containing protein
MTRFSVFLAFTLLATLAACGPTSSLEARSSSSTRAVTSGTLGSEADVGATVSLIMFGESGCTGTLIAPRVVVTAAHCVADLTPDQLEIVFSSTEPASAPASLRRGVASATAHPEFSFFGMPTDDPEGLSDERDIGVVVLDSDAPASVTPSQVLHLDDVDATLSEGDAVLLAGYGLTSDGSDADYGRLYVAETPYVRRSLAEFIAGQPGSPDTCNGDSGGPAYVVVDGVRHLAGITSRGTFTATQCGDGGIYTLFGAFEDFVEEASGGLYVSGGSDVDLPPPPPPPEGAGSCAGACDGASSDFSCFCDSFCEAGGDCCPDFRDECPSVPAWACGLDEIEDSACSCDCGAPDPACGADECGGENPPPDEPDPVDPNDDDDDPTLDPAGDDVDPQAPTCASMRGELPFALALALLVASRRRRRR